MSQFTVNQVKDIEDKEEHRAHQEPLHYLGDVMISINRQRDKWLRSIGKIHENN